MLTSKITKAVSIMLLACTPITSFGLTNNYKSMLDTYNTNNLVIPTEKHNISIEINKALGIEEYTYYDRINDLSETFRLEDGKLKTKVVDRKTLHPYELLYKEGSNIVYPEIDNTYFSYVSVLGDVEHITQHNTGKFDIYNCVPTVASMIYGWANNYNKLSDKYTPEYIRSIFPSDSTTGLGYTFNGAIDMYRQLKLKTSSPFYYTSIEPILEQLANGNLVSFYIDSSKIPTGDKDSRINKSYSGGGQHNIISTGYLYIIDESPNKTKRERLYLEVVDPAEYKEPVRYYLVDDFNKMMNTGNYKYAYISHNGDK